MKKDLKEWSVMQYHWPYKADIEMIECIYNTRKQYTFVKANSFLKNPLQLIVLYLLMSYYVQTQHQCIFLMEHCSPHHWCLQQIRKKPHMLAMVGWWVGLLVTQVTWHGLRYIPLHKQTIPNNNSGIFVTQCMYACAFYTSYCWKSMQLVSMCWELNYQCCPRSTPTTII